MISYALKFVYSDKRYFLLTIVISFLVILLYYSLIHIGGLFYPIIFGSIMIGEIVDVVGFAIISILIGISISMQVYYYRLTKSGNSKGKTTIAIITGIFAQGLCCTPIIGSFLSLLGLSTSTLLTLSGGISHTFAVLEPILILVSVFLLFYSIMSISRSLLYCKNSKFRSFQKTTGR